MLNIRIVILSVVLMFVVAGATYFAVTASPSAVSANSAPTCPVIHTASSLSTQALWDILNGRYERRVGLPR